MSDTEEKEQFDQDLSINGEKIEKVLKLGYRNKREKNKEKNDFIDNSEFSLYDDIEKEDLNLTPTTYLLYQLYRGENKEKLKFVTEDCEKPVNFTSTFEDFSVDVNKIDEFFDAGVITYAYRMYNNLQPNIRECITDMRSYKPMIRKYFDEKVVLDSPEIKELANTFGNGRAPSGQSEGKYISSVISACRKYRKFLEQKYEWRDGELDSLKNLSYFSTDMSSIQIDKRIWFDAVAVKKGKDGTKGTKEYKAAGLSYKDGDGEKAGKDKGKRFLYTDIPTRSGQLMMMAITASKIFSVYTYVDDEFSFQSYTPSEYEHIHYLNEFFSVEYVDDKNYDFKFPSYPVRVALYNKIASNLRDELLNENNSEELKIINQSQNYSQYRPFYKRLFKELNGVGTTESLKRSGADNIIIHFTAGGNKAEGDFEYSRDKNEQVAANFYIKTFPTLDVDSTKGSKSPDILMSAPHECWTGSIGVDSSKNNHDKPYYSSDGDEFRYRIRSRCLSLKTAKEKATAADSLIKYLSENYKNGRYNTPKEKDEANNSEAFIYNEQAFKEFAAKEVDKIRGRWNEEYLLSNGKAKEGYEDYIGNGFPERMSTNSKSIAIETSYRQQDVGDGASSPKGGKYASFYGGISLVRKDAMRNLKYTVKYLLDKYGLRNTDLRRHFDHGGKACPDGFIGDMAWKYLRTYLGGVQDSPDISKNDPLNVSESGLKLFISRYAGINGGELFDSAIGFAKRWNGIKAQKHMDWSKEMDAISNGSICKIVSVEDKGQLNNSDGEKIADMKLVTFQTLLYTEKPKNYENQGYIPAHSFYIEQAKVNFYDNAQIPTKDEDLKVTSRGEAVQTEEEEAEGGEIEEKKISINEVRSFINKWYCEDASGVDGKFGDGNLNAGNANAAADKSKGKRQELIDIQNYYDFYSGMTPYIQAKFRALGGKEDDVHSNWIGINSIQHPYFESLKISDNGVKNATLVLFDKDYASYQYGILDYSEFTKKNSAGYDLQNTSEKKTIYSLEQIIKQAIGVSKIATNSNKQTNTVDAENSEISDDFLVFSKSKAYGVGNLRLRWGYADANPKTSYRDPDVASNKTTAGDPWIHSPEKGQSQRSFEEQDRLTNWEKKISSSYRTNRWWDVEIQDDKNTFKVRPARYIENQAIKTGGNVILQSNADAHEGEEGVNVSREKLLTSENSTTLMTPWIEFMVTSLKTEVTTKGIKYTIGAIEAKDAEVIKDRFLQKYAQISTYPEEVLYILMSIFNENPRTGAVRKKSPIKLLLYKEATDPRAFINNELDFSNMPEELKEKLSKFEDTYSMDNAKPAQNLSEDELEKYLKKITLSFGSAEALKVNYGHSDKPNLYRSISSLLNEFCAACPPRKDKQFDEVIATEDGETIRSDSISEAARPLKWFTCKKPGDSETTYIVLYYRRALKPRKIRNYIWGPHNPYQSCVTNVSISSANEFAVLSGIEAFTPKGDKETKVRSMGTHGVFGQGAVDVRRNAEKVSEKDMEEGEKADFVFTDIKSRNNYQEAYSSCVYSGNIQIMGDPFFVFDGLMQPCTYPIRLDVLIPFNDFHASQGGAKYGGDFKAYDSMYNTYSDDRMYANQRRHEISGYYVIKKIEHTISPGKFVTNLEVLSYPKIENQILDIGSDGKVIEPPFKWSERNKI